MTHFQRHWLFVNMPLTKEDNILMKNLFDLKGSEFPRESLNVSSVYKLLQ